MSYAKIERAPISTKPRDGTKFSNRPRVWDGKKWVERDVMVGRKDAHPKKAP